MARETIHATAGAGSSSSAAATSSSGGGVGPWQGQGQGHGHRQGPAHGEQGSSANDAMMYFGPSRGHTTGLSMVDTGPKTPAEFLVQYNQNKKSTRAVYLGDEAAAAEEEHESYLARTAAAAAGSKTLHAAAGVQGKKKRTMSPMTSKAHPQESVTSTHFEEPAPATAAIEELDSENVSMIPPHTVDLNPTPTIPTSRPDSRGKLDNKGRPDSRGRPTSAASSSYGLDRDATSKARSSSPSPLDAHHHPHRTSSPQPTILELEQQGPGSGLGPGPGQAVSEYQQYHRDQHNKFKEDLCFNVEKELGLVLDAKLHARNARKKAFQTMVYFVAKHRKKHAFRHFKIQYGKWTAAIRDKATRLLQRVARGFFARTRARLKRRNRQLQIQAQLDREHRARALVRYHYCAKAMCFIQETHRSIRGHHLRT